MADEKVVTAPPAYAPPPRQGGCLPVLVLLLVIALGGSVLGNLVLLGGRAPSGKLDRNKTPLDEEWVDGMGEARICLIEVLGEIDSELSNRGPFSKPGPNADDLKQKLDAAKDDVRVKAVVLCITSPGGAVGASDRIWRTVREFRQQSGKPVVVSMGDVCASGGYYIAAAADYVVAEPTTITGSIGVIMQTFNVAKLIDRLDIETVTLTSGAQKDMLSPFAPVREEHKAIAKSVIDAAYERFVTIVAEGRAKAGLDLDRVRYLADGRIYTAAQALEQKLIDQIGYLDEVYAKARELAAAPDATVFRYTHQPRFLDMLTGRAEAALTTTPAGLDVDHLIDRALLGRSPRLFYLYAP